MNRKYLLVIVAVLFTNITTAQKVYFEYLKDDPENVHSYRVQLPLFAVQPSITNTAYTVNFGLEAQVNDKLYFSSIGSLFLIEKLFPNTQDGSDNPHGDYVSSQTIDQFSRYFQIEGTYYFKKSFEQKEVKLQLKKSGNVLYYVEVPAKMMKRSGLRLGYRQGFTWYHLHGGNFKSDVEFETKDQSTYLNYSQIRIGFAKAKTTNLHVNIEGYGKRAHAHTLLYYADFIYAISQRLEDVYYFNQSESSADGYAVYYTAHKIDEYNEKQKIGFEIGIRQLPLVGKVGYHAQLGTLTGVKGVFSAYFEMGICFSLGTREKAQ